MKEQETFSPKEIADKVKVTASSSPILSYLVIYELENEYKVFGVTSSSKMARMSQIIERKARELSVDEASK